MRVYVLLIVGALCLSLAVSDFNVPSLEVFQDGFQDGLDDISEIKMSEEEGFDKLTDYRQRKCTNTLCCPFELRCGEGFACWDNHKVIQLMVPCWLPTLEKS